MASPVFVAASRNFVGGGSPTSITVTEPTGAANGHGLIAKLMIEVGGTSPGTVNTPTGWFFLGRITTSAYTVDHYYIPRGASAPTYTIGWTVALNGPFQYAELNVSCWSGVVGPSFVESFALTTGSTGTQPDPAAVTTASADTTVLVVGYSWAGWSGGATLAGYTSRFGGGFYDTVGLSKAVAVAGSENPAAISAADGSDIIAAATFVLASVGGSAPATPTKPKRQLFVFLDDEPLLVRSRSVVVPTAPAPPAVVIPPKNWSLRRLAALFEQQESIPELIRSQPFAAYTQAVNVTIGSVAAPQGGTHTADVDTHATIGSTAAPQVSALAAAHVRSATIGSVAAAQTDALTADVDTHAAVATTAPAQTSSLSGLATRAQIGSTAAPQTSSLTVGTPALTATIGSVAAPQGGTHTADVDTHAAIGGTAAPQTGAATADVDTHATSAGAAAPQASALSVQHSSRTATIGSTAAPQVSALTAVHPTSTATIGSVAAPQTGAATADVDTHATVATTAPPQGGTHTADVDTHAAIATTAPAQVCSASVVLTAFRTATIGSVAAPQTSSLAIGVRVGATCASVAQRQGSALSVGTAKACSIGSTAAAQVSALSVGVRIVATVGTTAPAQVGAATARPVIGVTIGSVAARQRSSLGIDGATDDAGGGFWGRFP